MAECRSCVHLAPTDGGISRYCRKCQAWVFLQEIACERYTPNTPAGV